ncbi:PR-1-like protein [Penicillium sp. IBT 18751x]|nr:PR-1-like protein [Penicillium sp. IBT 18751x]
MRFLLLFAVLATGAVDPVEKSVFAADSTTVTITKTVTVRIVTGTVPTANRAQAKYESTALLAAALECERSHSLRESTVIIPETVTSASISETVASTSLSAPSPTTNAEEIEAIAEFHSCSSNSWAFTIEPKSTSTIPALADLTPAAATATTADAYQHDVLFHHNIHRRNHSAPSVNWSTDLETSARALAAKCVYEHDTSIDGGGYGQNIGYGVEASQIGVMLTNLMYNDEMEFFPTPYGEPAPSMTDFAKWGHFSQIIWRGTTHVGCATVVCDGLRNVDFSGSLPFTVCNYFPAGNCAGEYSYSVLTPRGHAVYIASSGYS